jgi:hypothetical protein
VEAVQRGDVSGLAMVLTHGDPYSMAVMLGKLKSERLTEAEPEPGTFRRWVRPPRVRLHR